MRGRRTFLVMATIGALLTMPTGAAANGGAYIDFDRTHYLPGDSGQAVTYVSIPERKESLFDRGPFHLFALPDGMRLEEGRPIPTDAIRLGTFSIEEEKGSYELAAEFTVPVISSGFYDMFLCNDPCTLSGFREPLSGSISVVATEREAALLNANARLHGRMWGLRSQVRKAERDVKHLERNMSFATSERGRMSAEIERLEQQLAAARRRAAEAADRAPFSPWTIAAVLAVALIAAAMMFRPRRRSPALADLDALEVIVGSENGSAARPQPTSTPRPVSRVDGAARSD
jgi:hypothetical protein